MTFFQTFDIPPLLLKEQNNMLTSLNVSNEHFTIYNKVKRELYWNAPSVFFKRPDVLIETPRRFKKMSGRLDLMAFKET